MERLFPWSFFRGHFRSLSDRKETSSRQNWPLTLLVYGLPLAVLILCWQLEQTFQTPVVLQEPGAVLTAAALLTGGALTAFTHLHALRLRLTERINESTQTDRDMLDEVAVHLIMAALASIFTAFVLVLGITFATGNTNGGVMSGPFAWIVFASLTFKALLYWIAFPRLYLTYVRLNDVSSRMSGTESTP
ncbi:hypothetical protein GCM10023169_34530 [Georgenia halophila]|uniref:Uncharacterized protein n=1 Tax=Georgenia halophila TaxID=620889 RepID=A0ABP8LLM7_9MICO